MSILFWNRKDSRADSSKILLANTLTGRQDLQ